MSGPVFCGDLVCGFKRIVGGPGFGDQFKKIVKRCVGVGCGLDVVRQSACLVWLWFPLWLHGGGSGLRLCDGFGVKLLSVGWCLVLICSWTHRGST